MNADNHNIAVSPPDITREDLELARQGFPSRSVTVADIQAVYRPMEPGQTRTFEHGDPGYRLLQAELDSPERQAAMEAYEAQREAEARADAAADAQWLADMDADPEVQRALGDAWDDLAFAYNYGTLEPHPHTLEDYAFRRMDEYARSEVHRVAESQEADRAAARETAAHPAAAAEAAAEAEIDGWPF